MATYSNAYSVGTQENRQKQAEAYIAFCVLYNFQPTSPPLIAAALYTQCLANSFKSLSTVRNYLSGARSWITETNGDPSGFTSPVIQTLLKGLARNSTHIPTPAPVLDIVSICKLCDVLETLGPDGLIARAAILIGFATFLRQSNLVSPSPDIWSGVHTIRRGDVTLGDPGLWVTVRSSKSIQRSEDQVSLPVPEIPNSRYCPCKAWITNINLVRAPPEHPAFIMYSTRLPLTTGWLTDLLRLALMVINHPLSRSATLHSLRRSAAIACAHSGVTLEELMAHGTWRSSAVHAYVPKPVFTNIPTIIKSMFGSSHH